MRGGLNLLSNIGWLNLLSSKGAAAAVATGIATIASVTAHAVGGSVGDTQGTYLVDIAGNNFTGTTAITFGGTAATNIVVNSNTSITCKVPAHASGVVSVLITNGFGTSAPNTAWEYYSPNQEAMTSWVSASFTGAPWVENASAGPSGTNANYGTGGADPTVGAAVNGRTPAQFDGTEFLNGDIAAHLFASGGGGSVFVLVNASSLPSDPGVNYEVGNLLGDVVNGEICCGYMNNAAGTTPLLFLTLSNAAAYNQMTAPAVAAGAWVLCQFRWSTTVAEARVNGSAWTTQAMPGWANTAAGAVAIGQGYAGARHHAGGMLEAGTLAARLADANWDKLRGYVRTRYQLTGI